MSAMKCARCVGVLCVALAVGACIFLMRGQFNSPDERANDFFARTWVQSGALSVAAPAQSAGLAYPLFPRSTEPVQNLLRPVGFIGLSLVYGVIASLMGTWILPYLTLIAFLCGAAAWWFLIARVFDKKNATISLWLYLLHPAFLYYTVRGMYPNVLLVSASLIAIAGAVRIVETKNWRARGAWIFVTVLSALIALFARPPEALLLFVLVASAAALFGNASISRAGKIGVIGVCVVALLVWFMRRVGALSGAYPFLRDSSLFGMLFPFGIHFKLIARTTFYFYFKLFWPWTLGAVAGFFLWWQETPRVRAWPAYVRAYVWVSVALSAWLFCAYGSWQLSDNPVNPFAVTIGISYVRYWLLAYLFAIPLVAHLILQLQKKWPTQKIVLISILALTFFGAWRVWSGVDGLGAVMQENRAAGAEVPAVIQLLPAHAVLAVRTWDKHFFPAVPVLQPFPQSMGALTAAHELLAAHIPVFAFIETLADVDVQWLSTNNLHARAVKTFGNQTLYEISE